MVIGICDDNEDIFQSVEQELENYMNRINIPYKFFTFRSANELIYFCSTDNERLDLLFMDIEMPDITGIELCRKVHENLPECKIAYHTNYLSFAPDVYETEHCYFVLKNQLKQRLPFVINKILEDKKKPKIIVLDVHGGKEAVQIIDILYMERNRKKTYIFLEGGNTIETCQKLDEILAICNSDILVRCHNSFVISFPKIKKYTRVNLQIGSEIIPISRKYGYKIKEQFTKWCGMQIS